MIDHFDIYPDIPPDEITAAAYEVVDIVLNRAMILRPEPGCVLCIVFLSYGLKLLTAKLRLS